MYLFKIGIALYIGIIAVCCTGVERVDDSDLIHLLTGKDDVVALFTNDHCAECLEYEKIVVNGQDEFEQTLGATVVQAHNSNLIHIYDPSREPALLYFRRGIPILYYGGINVDEMLQFFNDNREPAVKELSDEHFEHLTQASTGATTGDWFIFFYSAECVLCQRLYAIWESVGGRLKQKMNVARMNSLGSGVSTAKRLNVLEAPEFVFLRHGKLYRYTSEDYTPKAFIEFAEGAYLNAHPEKIQPPESLFGDITFKRVAEYYKNCSTITLSCIATIIVSFLLYILTFFAKSFKKPITTKKDK